MYFDHLGKYDLSVPTSNLFCSDNVKANTIK